ncbi:peptidase domain-containing ABC transporter [Aestuariibacter salexigens]|uniref:peptidase domain-containing ABC transporter n=1 Tax=Aestuariibacter salexigens TaxID=226010 RepID=UPI0006847956|nr:peptidase domain-containing ABC transporter [Aestuariibacter salexigens]
MTTASFTSRPEKLLHFSIHRRLPVILQSEVNECGLACLAMLTSFYGRRTDLQGLRRRFAISAQGTTLKQLMDAAGRLSLSGRALKLDVESLKHLQTPCILHWEMNHFVVLKKVSAKAIVIHDPAIGERRLHFNEVSKAFTGIALEVTPTSDFSPGDEKTSLSFTHLWSKIIGLRRALGLILLLSLMLQAFAIISPYYMQIVIDDVLLRSDQQLLAVLAIGFVFLLLIDAGTSAVRRFALLHLSSRLNLQMSANVFAHLVRLSLDYFGKRHMGDVVSRFASLNVIRELMTTGMVAVLLDGIMALITLTVMYIYSATLTFIVLAVVIAYALLRITLYRPVRLLTEEKIIASATEQSHFMESVRAMQTIKLFSKECEREGQWQNKLASTMNKDIRLAHWDIGFQGANQLLFGIENIIVIYFAAMAVMDNAMSVGMLYAFIAYKTRFVGAMDGLITKWIEFRMLDVQFERLADIVFCHKESHHAASHQHSPADAPSQIRSGSLTVRQLSYRYGDLERPVFSDINVEITAGQTVAIVGTSGCGKTTLMKCMMGLLRPCHGEVLIDGMPLTGLHHYRQHIAAVMQDDNLLSGSIADNIACFDAQVNISRVVECARLACIHDDIVQMNMQYQTYIGELGSSLSGGQKQRILLARALYRQPKILFLDEATSHLDCGSERLINQHIQDLSMTRIIIAHRPETIRSAARILRLDETGLHDCSLEQAMQVQQTDSRLFQTKEKTK